MNTKLKSPIGHKGYKMAIKKTVQATYDLLIGANVNELISVEAWEAIEQSMTAKAQTASGAPREVTLLKDLHGEVIGRLCTLSRKWFPIASFFKGTSVIKELDQEKAKVYNAAKKLEKEAEVIREEAKTAETPEDKLAVYDRYEAALDTAKAARTTPVDAKIVTKAGKDGLDSIEALADSLGVVLGETANVPKVKEEQVEEA